MTDTLERFDCVNGRFYSPFPTDDEGQIIEDFPLDQRQFAPSVTTIIDKTVPKGKGYDIWLGNSPSYEHAQDYGAQAATHGTAIHSLIQQLLEGDTVEVEGDFYDRDTKVELGSQESKALMGFKQFYDEYKPETIAVEEMMWHTRSAGTLDYLCWIDSESWLIDFKSGKPYPKQHELQLTGYKDLKQLNDPTFKVDHIAALYSPQDAKKKFFRLTEYEYAIEAWQVCLDHYAYLEGTEPKFRKEYPTTFTLED